jgi:hypothetical protein
VIALRTSAFVVAGIAGLIVLQPLRVSAQWWSRAPADFEECAEAAEKAATKEDKTAALASCNAKFAARRKPGGGYAYYDFMQDRTFDIAGPNPTPQEQKYIDEQYTLYLENRRHDNVVAAFTARQQQQQLQLQQASLQSEPEKVPVPQQRPTRLQPAASQPTPSPDTRPHLRSNTCPKHSFSCEWPRLSEGLSDLKKLFSPSPNKAKRS